jgi:VCBS repeat protein
MGNFRAAHGPAIKWSHRAKLWPFLAIGLFAPGLSGCGAGVVGLAYLFRNNSGKPSSNVDALPVVDAVEISAPETPDRLHIHFRIEAATGARFAARVAYQRQGGDATPQTPTLVPAVDGTDSGTTGSFHFVWDAGRDLAGDSANVVITIVPSANEVEGKAYHSSPMRAGNTTPDVKNPLLTAGGDPADGSEALLVSFELKDKESDPLGLVALMLSVDGGEFSPLPSAILDSLPRKLPSDAQGFPNSLLLPFTLLRTSGDTAIETIASAGFVGTLKVRVTVQDFASEEQITGESDALRFDNNDEPFIQFLPVPDVALTKGVVPIRYRIFDKEKNPADLDIEVDLGDGSGYQPAWEFPSSASSGLRGLETIPTLHAQDSGLPFHTFLWAGHLQAPNGGNASFRVHAKDRDLGPENIIFAEIPGEFAKPVQEIEVEGMFTEWNAIVDFDQDGFPDILVPNIRGISQQGTDAQSVAYFRGGRGGLTLIGQLPTGPLAYDVVSGDFDGDHFPDAAVFHTEGATLFKGSAEGLKRDPRQIDFEWGKGEFTALWGSKSADFNRDGFDDVISSSLFTQQLFLFRGGKDGLQLEPPLKAGDQPYQSAIGDFNGDGYTDFLGVNRATTDLNLLRGGPNGLEFVRFVPISPDGSWPEPIVAGNFDGDGFDDAFVGLINTNQVVFFNGAPDPQIVIESTHFAVSNNPWILERGDFNRDGFDDVIVFCKGTDHINVFEGGAGGPHFHSDIQVGKDPVHAAISDVDTDGYPDAIVVGSFSKTVAFLRGGPNGLRFAARVELDRNIQFGNPFSGDFDGDGVPEFVSGPEESGRFTRFAGVHGGLSPFSKGNETVVDAVAAIAADFNHDGFADTAVAGHSSASISVAHGSANGLVGNQVIAVEPGPVSLVAADLDGDTFPELVVASTESENLAVLQGGPDGLREDQKTTIKVGIFPRALASGDFDGDGQLDLAVSLWNSDRVVVLVGRGSGLPEPKGEIAVGRQPIALSTGDLDQDGDLDLIVANWGASTVTIIRGNTAGLSDRVETLSAGTFPHLLSLQDFDGDGSLDLAVVNYGSQDITCFLDGRGGLPRRQRFPVGAFPVSVSVDDFDADGFMDLVTANSGARTVSFVRGGPAGMSGGQTINLLESGTPVAVRSIDFDGDGFIDLLVATQKPGEIVGLRGGTAGLRLGGVIARGSEPRILLTSDVDADGFDDAIFVDAGSARVVDLRTSYSTRHGLELVDRAEPSRPLVVQDGRSPSRFRLEIEPGGEPAGQRNVAAVPALPLSIPQEAANARGKYFTVVTDAVALLRDGIELSKPARLSLRLRDHDRSLLDAAIANSSALHVVHRRQSTGGGELEGAPIEIQDFEGAKWASFPITRFGRYMIVLEQGRR